MAMKDCHCVVHVFVYGWTHDVFVTLVLFRLYSFISGITILFGYFFCTIMLRNLYCILTFQSVPLSGLCQIG